MGGGSPPPTFAITHTQKNIMTKQEQLEEDRTLILQALEEECYIDPNKKIEKPPVAISFGQYTSRTKEGITTNPTPIGTYGNISFIAAPPKHKKTFLVSLLSAAYLGGNSSRFTGDIKGHREDGRCLYHFDTEQGEYHAHRVFRRVLDMSELDNECYRTFGLRSLSSVERLDLIDYLIKTSSNLGVVVIDGVADLVSDVNNIDEANKVVQKMMTWTKDYNIHLVTVIHSNWGSNKPTGHLGSALQKKAETEILLEKNETNEKIIDVICKSSRNKSFDSFGFTVNDFGYPEVTNQNIEVLDIINGNQTRNRIKTNTAPISSVY